ncbi:hypothetical protein VRM59_004482 [Salmonella enterica]|nr:hypothetical protein [Salmonella enterica]
MSNYELLFGGLRMEQQKPKRIKKGRFVPDAKHDAITRTLVALLRKREQSTYG